MKFGKREKTLTFLIGGLAVIFLFERVAISPFLNRLKFIDTQMLVNEKKIARMLYIDSKKDTILDTFNNEESNIRVGTTEESALAAIMKEIEEITKDSGVTLLSMKPDSTAEVIEGDCVVKKVNLSIEGAQRNIIKFLYKIDNSNYPLRLNRMDFKIKDKEKNLMEADIEAGFICFLKSMNNQK